MSPRPAARSVLAWFISFLVLGLTGFETARLLFAQTGAASGKSAPPTQAAGAAGKTQADLERELQGMLTNAVMVGTFTIDGAAKTHNDRYTIVKAAKLAGDLWTITARMQYADKDITVPVPVQIKWAGDTPVITLTDLTIPGLGTFTARVLLFRDRYAGTWQHDQVGGCMTGKIERAKSPPQKTP